MPASTNENTIVCLSDAVRDTLYVYRYYWTGNTKAQSAWSKWTMPAGTTVLCTEKDAAKLWQVQPDALAVPLVFEPEPAFFQALDAKLSSLDG